MIPVQPATAITTATNNTTSIVLAMSDSGTTTTTRTRTTTSTTTNHRNNPHNNSHNSCNTTTTTTTNDDDHDDDDDDQPDMDNPNGWWWWIWLRLRTGLVRFQSKLDFEDWAEYPQFATPRGLGRVACIASLLSMIGTIHFLLWMALSFGILPPVTTTTTTTTTLLPQQPLLQEQDDDDDASLRQSACRWMLLWQWCAYMTLLCTFHGLEFFTTALFNPTAATADSFLVNHSTTYTAAFVTSSLEFWCRWIFCPNLWYTTTPTTSSAVSLGLVLVLASQTIRTWAMVTAGESFHHVIQTHKKNNHVLVTHGIYAIFRHPSYVGFFYWSIATQILLGNVLHATLFAVSSWQFFNRRIPYEEESLCQLFPHEYPAYRKRTWIGIPFIQSNPI